MWGLVYVSTHVCISARLHVFLFTQYFTCVCYRVRGSPQGLSDIWLRMDSLYLLVICAVKPLGAAAAHIITTLLGLYLERL